MLRSVVSHTTGSNCSMVRTDALTSLRTCLALLQAAVSHTIGSNWAWSDSMSRPASTWCAELPRDMPRLGRATGSDTIGTSRAVVHADRTPSAVTLTWSARIPRTASAHALCCYRRLARTPSAGTATWCEQMPRPASTWCVEQPRAFLAKLWASGSHIIGTSRAMVHSAAGFKKVSPFQTADATGTCLAHHRH